MLFVLPSSVQQDLVYAHQKALTWNAIKVNCSFLCNWTFNTSLLPSVSFSNSGLFIKVLKSVLGIYNISQFKRGSLSSSSCSPHFTFSVYFHPESMRNWTLYLRRDSFERLLTLFLCEHYLHWLSGGSDLVELRESLLAGHVKYLQHLKYSQRMVSWWYM